MNYRTRHGDAPLVRRFAPNSRGRNLIVGDIHGCFGRLQARLDAVGFDPDAGDRLFSVGDLIDRGAESDAVLDWLDRPWFHPVLGNHEQMALLYTVGEQDAEEYAANGGAWFLHSSEVRRDEIARRLAGLPVAIELATPGGTVGIVHADCPAEAWSDFIEVLESNHDEASLEGLIDDALWSRDRCLGWCEDEVEGVRAVVVGHTAMMRWMTLGNVIHIDTGAWMDDQARDFCLLDAATLRPVNERP